VDAIKVSSDQDPFVMTFEQQAHYRKKKLLLKLQEVLRRE